MRTLVVGLARLLLRVFFRRISVVHAERLPASGPVVYVLNHPNGLVDPLFILVFAGRRVSFLAKEPLFHMFFIGWCLRQLEALPVYRTRDHADPAQNRKTFDDARALLARGGSIALFPEGTSHSDPSLKPLKTGAARIALGAAAEPERLPLRIIPVGLAYSAKQHFRSQAQIFVGEPFDVAHVAMTEAGEPPPDPVHALTARIGEALNAVTLQSDRVETLRAIELAERLFSVGDPGDPRDLEAALELKRRLASAEASLRPTEPELVRQVTERVLSHAAALEAFGVAEHHVAPARLGFGFLAGRLLVTLLWLPLSVVALLGVLLNFLPYRFTAFVARRASHGEDDQIATIKLLAALLAYPLGWALLAGLAAAWPSAHRLGAGLTVALAGPLLAYFTLVFRERLGSSLASLRALRLWLFRRRAFTELLAERRAIKDLMSKIAETLPT